jgi:transcriptional regulator with XRE-family HTH domain
MYNSASTTHKSVSQVQNVLGQILLRLQVSQGRRLTYRDLAEMAGTSERTMAEWMRGATSPMAMNALLNLMSALKAEDATSVLALWREMAHQEPADAHMAQRSHK